VAVRRAQVGQLRGVMSQRGGGRKAGWPMGWRVARRQAGDKFARLNFLSLSLPVNSAEWRQLERAKRRAVHSRQTQRLQLTWARRR